MAKKITIQPITILMVTVSWSSKTDKIAPNKDSVDTSNYKTFDKDIPRVKLANGDTLNDYEYEIMKKKGLLGTFYTTGWTKYLEQMVYGD